MTPTQASLDAKNAEFWNELCGTTLAKSLHLTDHSPDCLRRFDEAYLAIYPYLLPIVQTQRMAGRDVLEIGLGYGTLGQQIMRSGARYAGLDLAPNAVRMMNHRLQMQGSPGSAYVGSALAMPFAAESFDFVVSIGCFHHTGNVQRCFDETWRVLRPGGTAILMVYNKYSLRQWSRWPVRTCKALLCDWGLLRSPAALDENERRAYDENHVGVRAPATVLLGKRELGKMLQRFERLSLQTQNADPLAIRGRALIAREKLLSSVGRRLGLDIYIEAHKGAAARSDHGVEAPIAVAKAG